jgi:hypothetical protein
MGCGTGACDSAPARSTTPPIAAVTVYPRLSIERGKLTGGRRLLRTGDVPRPSREKSLCRARHRQCSSPRSARALTDIDVSPRAEGAALAADRCFLIVADRVTSSKVQPDRTLDRPSSSSSPSEAVAFGSAPSAPYPTTDVDNVSRIASERSDYDGSSSSTALTRAASSGPVKGLARKFASANVKLSGSLR